MHFLIGLLVGLAVLAIAFTTLERFFPAIRNNGKKRTGRLTDVGWYFFNSTITRVLTTVVLAAVILLGVRAFGQSWDGDDLRRLINERDTWITDLPTGLQLGMFVVCADFMAYWIHRTFHWQPRLWRIHAIHHSSRNLDWLGAVRVHPLNDVIQTTAQAIPLLLIGFPVGVLGGYVAIIGFGAILLHSNVPWTWGPLRYGVASPVFHRWHHTTEKEGIDKNFAGLLPVWDLLFGTWYMPRGRQPMRFGVLGERVPEGLWKQLVYPLLPRRVLVSV